MEQGDSAKTSVLQEEARVINAPQWVIEQSTFYHWMQRKGFKTEKEMREWSSTNYIDFRDEMAKTYADWYKPYTRILDDSCDPYYKWFLGGKINMAHNAVDRHALSAKRNKVAYYFIGEPWEIPGPSPTTSFIARPTSRQMP